MKNKNIRVSYASAVFGKPEVKAVMKVLSDPNKIVAGPAVKEFEKKIAQIFGKKFGVMVNSGSSANLMAIESLGLPVGSEIITPVLTFATTVAPIVQKGLVPVFVDIEPGKYIIDVDKIEKAITKNTRALMIPLLIGSIPDMDRLREIAKKHNLYFIEDSCDTLGAKFDGKPTGAYSDISTTSFYASHIITTAGGGGMVCFNDPALAKKALIMSNWGRNSTLFGVYEKSEELDKRFAGRLDGDVYDAKFIFSMVGYNLQVSELNAAFGLEQLKRLNNFKKIRQKNFASMMKFLKKYEEFFVLPKTNPKSNGAWMNIPLTIKEGVGFSRAEITEYLERQNIQTRPIFTGNILKQPGFSGVKSITVAEGYPVADYVMKNGFLVGCHHGMKEAHLNHLKKSFASFLEKFRGK